MIVFATRSSGGSSHTWASERVPPGGVQRASGVHTAGCVVDGQLAAAQMSAAPAGHLQTFLEIKLAAGIAIADRNRTPSVYFHAILEIVRRSVGGRIVGHQGLSRADHQRVAQRVDNAGIRIAGKQRSRVEAAGFDDGQ